MNRVFIGRALTLIPVLIATSAIAQLGPPRFSDLDHSRRVAIVDSLTAALDTVYVFPDVATAMVEDVRRKVKSGEYDDIADPHAFAARLTNDLREISKDLHLSVGVTSPPPPQELEDPAVARARWDDEEAHGNYGFIKVERLAGNVGYLKLNRFSGHPDAAATANAAMTFLAGCDAIIFDLTDNGGGSPSMVQLLCSYLLEGRVHLNSFYVRATDDMRQYWTQQFLPGPRSTETPAYVLTSSNTFSGAEEFSYNLKNLERATLVGETTGGGAHPVDRHFFDFGEYHVTMSLPFGRAINPITETNWEGTGVSPHISCSRADALQTAYLDALNTLMEESEDEGQRFELMWARDGIQAELEPVQLSSSTLDEFVGQYGPRSIRREGDTLIYQREGRDPTPLKPLSADTFQAEGIAWFRVRFERDSQGEVERIVGLYQNGHVDGNPRVR